MSVDVAVQKAVRLRLTTSAKVTALVPPSSILDTNQRPAPMPSIIIGEGVTVEGDRLDRRDQEVSLTLHIWNREIGLVGAKQIAGAIRKAIMAGNFGVTDDVRIADARVTRALFFRDPDGETAHGVVHIDAKAYEVAA